MRQNKNWRPISLGDCISTKKGFAFKSSWFEEVGHAIVKVSDFTNDSIDCSSLTCVSKEVAKDYISFSLATGDVVVQTVGSWPSNPESVVGKAIRVPNKANGALLNQNAVRLDPISGLDRLFLFYLLRTDHFKSYIVNTAQGAASQAAITLESLRAFVFYIPPINIQRKIASILSAYDDLIENNTRRIAILEEMAQPLYREWFVEFRFPGHEKVKLVDSPLGKIPGGWEIKRLGEICEKITSGGTPNTSIEDYWGGGIPWLSSGETGNHFIITTQKTITDKGVANSSTRFARAGCTVIASAGQGKTRGQTSLLQLDCYINQSTIAVISDGKRTKDFYLFFDMFRRYEQFRKISDGSSRGSLTTKLLSELEVVAPPNEIVLAFEEIVTSVVKEAVVLLKTITNLRKTRDLLLPKLISGQLDVENLDIDIGQAASE